jgi:HlyD family secretion protein
MYSFVSQRLLLSIVLTILLAVVVSGCSDQREKSKATEVLTVFGNVDIREVQLAFQDAGRILNVRVDEGAIVSGSLSIGGEAICR